MNLLRNSGLELACWGIEAQVEKWYDEADLRAGLRPDAIVYDEGNLLVNAGIQRLEDLLIGAGGQAYDNTHCRIGVGNGSVAATAADTDLGAAAGSANRYFQMMDATFPSRASQTVTFKATFASANGNFAWNEWGIDQGTSSGTTVTAPLLNHKLPAGGLGTKASGAAWAFTVTVVIS